MEKLNTLLGTNIDDDECICEENTLELPCTDPYLPGTMMRTPVYSKVCKHLQCFDLERFIKMNERMKRWTCPHCSEKAIELIVNTYLEALLVTIRPLDLDIPKIVVDRDGDFKVNDTCRIKYINGKFLLEQSQPKADLFVRLQLPKEPETKIMIREGQLIPQSQIKPNDLLNVLPF